MGEAKRRGKERQRLAEVVDEAMRKLITSDADDMILVGPVTPPAGKDPWFFVAFAGCAANRHEYKEGLITVGDQVTVEVIREAMLREAANRAPSISTLVFDDDLTLAEFGMGLWPDRFRETYTKLLACEASWETVH